MREKEEREKKMSDITLPEFVGAMIEHHRGDKSVAQIAEDLGVSRQWMYRVISGHTCLSLSRLMEVADALNVSPCELLPTSIR